MNNHDFVLSLKDRYDYDFEEIKQTWLKGLIWTLYRIYTSLEEFAMILITSKNGDILYSRTAVNVPIRGWFERMQTRLQDFNAGSGCYIPTLKGSHPVIKRESYQEFWDRVLRDADDHWTYSSVPTVTIRYDVY